MANDFYVIPVGYFSTQMEHGANLQFSKPYWNGIRIISSELTAMSKSFPWYGDLMTLRMWGQLNLNVGTTTSSVLTRQDGYLYEYNAGTKEFTVYDDTGNIVVHITNVKSIGDMKIDFTIANSHQFKVIVTGSSEASKYFITGHFDKPLYNTRIELEDTEGIGNTYFADLSRPYDKDDINNPEFYIKHLATYESLINMQGSPTLYSIFGEWSRLQVANGGYYQYTGINKYPTLSLNKVLSNTYFYLDDYYFKSASFIDINNNNPPPPYDPKAEDNCAGKPVTIIVDGVEYIGIIASKGIKKEDIEKFKAKDYKECDLVTYNYKYYRCKADYTSNGDFEAEIDNWIEVKSKLNSDYLCGTCDGGGGGTSQCHDGINLDYYAVHSKSEILPFEIGRKYKKDEVISYKSENNFVANYIVLQDFTATDIGIDSKYLNKICDLIILVSKIKKGTFTRINVDVVLPEWSKSLYPKLMPIERTTETINNRPVYEPWMIWGKYKFVIAGYGENWNNDVGIDVWDLSPSW